MGNKNGLMFQNRKALVRDRGAYMHKAYVLVETLVENFEDTYQKEKGPEELLEQVNTLVKILENARYLGFRSIGGNAQNPPENVTPKELALIDHISVMFSSAKLIYRFLKHECEVRSYERKHPTEDKSLKKYIKDVENEDYHLILLILKNMKKRMDLFIEFFGNIIR